MANCGSCGMYVPDGQSSCSMCYGDPYHGKDGYYLQWLEEQQQKKEEEKQQIEQEQENG